MHDILNKLSTDQLKRLGFVIDDVLRQRGEKEIAPSATPSKKASDFRYGQDVKFRDRDGKIRTAKVIKVNSKTVGVVEIATGHQWRVSPIYLELLIT